MFPPPPSQIPEKSGLPSGVRGVGLGGSEGACLTVRPAFAPLTEPSGLPPDCADCAEACADTKSSAAESAATTTSRLIKKVLTLILLYFSKGMAASDQA